MVILVYFNLLDLTNNYPNYFHLTMVGKSSVDQTITLLKEAVMNNLPNIPPAKRPAIKSKEGFNKRTHYSIPGDL